MRPFLLFFAIFVRDALALQEDAQVKQSLASAAEERAAAGRAMAAPPTPPPLTVEENAEAVRRELSDLMGTFLPQTRLDDWGADGEVAGLLRQLVRQAAD